MRITGKSKKWKHSVQGMVFKWVCIAGCVCGWRARVRVFLCEIDLGSKEVKFFFSLSKLFVSLYGTGKGARFYTELGYECV